MSTEQTLEITRYHEIADLRIDDSHLLRVSILLPFTPWNFIFHKSRLGVVNDGITIMDSDVINGVLYIHYDAVSKRPIDRIRFDLARSDEWWRTPGVINLYSHGIRVNLHDLPFFMNHQLNGQQPAEVARARGFHSPSHFDRLTQSHSG